MLSQRQEFGGGWKHGRKALFGADSTNRGESFSGEVDFFALDVAVPRLFYNSDCLGFEDASSKLLWLSFVLGSRQFTIKFFVVLWQFDRLKHLIFIVDLLLTGRSRH